MYVIMKQKQDYAYYHEPYPHEIANSEQIAKDRIRTLNKAARVNCYWYEKAKPILDASGRRAPMPNHPDAAVHFVSV